MFLSFPIFVIVCTIPQFCGTSPVLSFVGQYRCSLYYLWDALNSLVMTTVPIYRKDLARHSFQRITITAVMLFFLLASHNDLHYRHQSKMQASYSYQSRCTVPLATRARESMRSTIGRLPGVARASCTVCSYHEFTPLWCVLLGSIGPGGC